MLKQKRFYFRRIDLFPCAVNLLLHPPADLNVARRCPSRQITGAVIAVLRKGLAVVLGCPIVAGNRVRPAHHQLAEHPRSSIRSVLIDNPDIVLLRQRPALAAQYRLLIIVQRRTADQPFRHAKHLLQLAAQLRHNPPRKRLLKHRPSNLQHFQTG
ncbi:hypothetical protein D3C75_831650 [compost metagenome]